MSQQIVPSSGKPDDNNTAERAPTALKFEMHEFQQIGYNNGVNALEHSNSPDKFSKYYCCLRCGSTATSSILLVTFNLI